MICSYEGKVPVCDPTARVAENATLVGSVTLGARSSVWYGAVLRGDCAPIHVGENSNIQDNAVVHCEPALPTVIGDGVTVGHGAILHGCTVEDGVLIGMGAILLNGCVIGKNSLVAAGALVTQNTVIPPESLVVGSPARVLRPLRPEEKEHNAGNAEIYMLRAKKQLPLAGSREENGT